MEYLNKIDLRGRVGFVRVTNTGEMTRVAFQMVTNRVYHNAAGEAVINSTWHYITYWTGNENNPILGLQIGDAVFVSGRLEYARYTGSDGALSVRSEIIATRVEKIDGQEEGF